MVRTETFALLAAHKYLNFECNIFFNMKTHYVDEDFGGNSHVIYLLSQIKVCCP